MHIATVLCSLVSLQFHIVRIHLILIPAELNQCPGCLPADKEHAPTPAFRKFRRQLYHTSLAHILRNLKPAMTKPEVMRFGDGHYRRVIFGLGPYIADYEEQVLLACIVRGWCVK